MLDCLKEKEDPTYRTVIEELGKRMNEMGNHVAGAPGGEEKLVDEYFTTVLSSALGNTNAAWLDLKWTPKFVACFAVTGGSEGHYIHVDAYPSRYTFGGVAEEKPIHLALGKTFKGWEHAWHIARICAEQLGA